MANNMIDAYIEERHENNETNYNLYFHYNGLDFAFLYKDQNAEIFAIDFKWKYLVSNPAAFNHTFTDNKGNTKEKRDYKSFISSIKGIEEIDEAIINLIVTSVNLDIQSDLTLHFNEKEYPLVRDVDNKEYFAGDTLKVSKKGISKDQLHEIDKDIRLLKTQDKATQY